MKMFNYIHCQQGPDFLLHNFICINEIQIRLNPCKLQRESKRKKALLLGKCGTYQESRVGYEHMILLKTLFLRCMHGSGFWVVWSWYTWAQEPLSRASPKVLGGISVRIGPWSLSFSSFTVNLLMVSLLREVLRCLLTPLSLQNDIF